MDIQIIVEVEGEKQVKITLDPSEYGDQDWEKVCHETGNKVSSAFYLTIGEHYDTLYI